MTPLDAIEPVTQTGRLVALSNRIRQHGRNTTPIQHITEDKHQFAFDAAASLLRKSNEVFRARQLTERGDSARHAELANRFDALMSAALQPSSLTDAPCSPTIHVSEAAQVAHEAMLHALSPEREWWRVIVPSGGVVDVRQAQGEWPWESDADVHTVRPSEPGWQSIIRRKYALPTGLPQGSALAPSSETLNESESSAAWIALCGMPPALYVSASTSSVSALLDRTADPSLMMRRLGVIDPWSPAAAQLDAAAAAQAARDADVAAEVDPTTGVSQPVASGDFDESGGGLSSVAWELAAAPSLDFYKRGAPVATAALAVPAESVAHRVRVAFEAAQGAFKTTELLSTASDREARLVSEVAARRIQHAWRGSRKIAAARAELWGRRERVRSAALHRLATVQDAMVQFCRVLEQGVGIDMGASELARPESKPMPAPSSTPKDIRNAPSSEVKAPHASVFPGSINSSISSALGTFTSRVAAVSHTVSTPGRAATPVALRIANGHGNGLPLTAARGSDSGGLRNVERDQSTSLREPLASTPGIDRQQAFASDRLRHSSTNAHNEELRVSDKPNSDKKQRSGLPPVPTSKATPATEELSEPLKLLQQLATQRNSGGAALTESGTRSTSKPALTMPSPRDYPTPRSAPPKSVFTPSSTPRDSAGLPTSSVVYGRGHDVPGTRGAAASAGRSAVLPLGSA